MTQEDWEKYGGLALRRQRRPGQPFPADLRGREDPRGPGHQPLGHLRPARRTLQGVRGSVDVDTGRGARTHPPKCPARPACSIQPARPTQRFVRSSDSSGRGRTDDPSVPTHSVGRDPAKPSASPPRRRPLPATPAKGQSATSDPAPDARGLAVARRLPRGEPRGRRSGQPRGRRRLLEPRRHRSGRHRSVRHAGGNGGQRRRGSDGPRRCRHVRQASGRHAPYTVRAGDTLGSIADSLDLDGGWRALYAANKDGHRLPTRTMIVPGQTLDVPGE